MGRLSGLHKDVLSLYRAILREARAKDCPETFQYVREEFRSQAHSIGKRDFQVIEHMLRHGHTNSKCPRCQVSVLHAMSPSPPADPATAKGSEARAPNLFVFLRTSKQAKRKLS